MPHYLSDEELKRTAPAEVASFRSPVPTQIVSNGEFNPLPQTREQQRVEARIKELADDLGRRHGMDRRQFLASSAGMAAAFLAMNEVFGSIFDVSRAEAADPGVAAQRAGMLSGQFIFDDQTHFVRDDFKQEGLLGLAQYAKQHWNPALWGEKTLARFKLENYLKEVFVDSDTKVALLSGAPFDDQTWDLLSNDQIAMARAAINKIADSRRLLGHAVFTPKRQGWMNEVDRAISTLKPDSWKGYTIGDPLFPSKMGSYWRLDDQKLMYPFYEKIVKAGITTVCIHKGLLPIDYEKSWPGVWEYNTVWDVGQAAKDWPQVNRSEEHTSELQSQSNLVCRLLLEKKKKRLIIARSLEMTKCTAVRRSCSALQSPPHIAHGHATVPDTDASRAHLTSQDYNSCITIT